MSGQEVLTWPDKVPSDVLDYDFNYTEWLLGPDGVASDTIVSSTWAVTSGDVTISSNSFASPYTKAWVSGGTIGTQQVLTNQIVTALGRTRSETGTFTVVAKNDAPADC